MWRADDVMFASPTDTAPLILDDEEEAAQRRKSGDRRSSLLEMGLTGFQLVALLANRHRGDNLGPVYFERRTRRTSSVSSLPSISTTLSGEESDRASLVSSVSSADLSVAHLSCVCF